MTTCVRIQTGCRLHFGPLAAGAESGRSFGGIGLVLDEPGFELVAQPASEDRLAVAEEYRRRVTQTLAAVRSAAGHTAHAGLQLELRRTIPRHRGLGSGTQLALAVAQGVCGASVIPASQLARWTGRGVRSAIGIHGYEQGGFLVDAGKSAPDAVGTIAVRTPFPSDWPILLWMPSGADGLAGEPEREAFHRLPPMSTELTNRLCALVLRELLPAITARDWLAFSHGLRRYGDLVGDYFAPAQGGVWAHPRGAEVVRWLESRGYVGAAQSSWGPTIAAVLPQREAAESLRREWPFAAGELQIARVRNRGADVTRHAVALDAPSPTVT